MCLGGRNPVSPRADGVCLGPGEALLLCSDGLWQQVEQREIHGMLTETVPRDALNRLVETARIRGGRGGDNVSAVLATRRVSRLQAAWRRLLPAY
jgi:serine/threonine protein phosphatase PrpC